MLSDPMGTVWLNILFVIIIPVILYIGCCTPERKRSENSVDKTD